MPNITDFINWDEIRGATIEPVEEWSPDMLRVVQSFKRDNDRHIIKVQLYDGATFSKRWM